MSTATRTLPEAGPARSHLNRTCVRFRAGTARALCGRWMHPGTDHRDGRISPSGERLCGRCANTRRYRGLT